MYEEALREEGRDEMAEKCKEMSKMIEEMSKVIDKHTESQRIQAEHLKARDISYEDAKEIMVDFSEEELKRIYGEQ